MDCAKTRSNTGNHERQSALAQDLRKTAADRSNVCYRIIVRFVLFSNLRK